MKIPKTLAVAALAAIAGASLATGVTLGVAAGAGGSSTTAPTWFGCLSKSGGLSKVGTVAPTCSSVQKAISWNSFPVNANGTPQCTGIPHKGIDLSGCDLEGANFTGVDLSGSKFIGSNLAATTYFAPNFTGADFSGADLTNAALCGPGATVYSGCYPDIIEANFTNANLTNVRWLFNGNTYGAIWSNTTCPNGTNSSSYSPQTCIGHGI